MAVLATIARERSVQRSRQLLRLAVLAVLLFATYPVALLGHFAVDLALGDRQMLRELQYGYARVLAGRLLHGWAHSAIPVAFLWLLLHALERLRPTAYGLLALGTAAAVAGLALMTPLPPLIAWLVLAAVLLRGGYRLASRRIPSLQP
jgi:hypothetical protein